MRYFKKITFKKNGAERYINYFKVYNDSSTIEEVKAEVQFGKHDEMREISKEDCIELGIRVIL